MARPLLLLSIPIVLTAPSAGAQTTQGRDAGAELGRHLSEAEQALRSGEVQTAESHFRSALVEGWLVLGSLALDAGDLEGARAAFEMATGSAVETRRAETALAMVSLQLGDPGEAVTRLRRLLGRHPGDREARRLLAQALVAAGSPAEAVQELEEGLAESGGDAELSFTLATGYLRLGEPERAAELFDELVRERPIPATHVLIGRTYRDFQLHDRARVHLERALEMDPEAQRARFYLGTIELLQEGRARLPEALDHFEKELRLGPEEPLVNFYYGMALAEDRRFAEALEALAIAIEAPGTPVAAALYYRGRSLLGLDRPAEAAVALERALAAALEEGPDDRQLSSIHYQLALALRAEGRMDEAAPHFDAAERYSEKMTAGERERLSRYLADELERETDPAAFVQPLVVDSIEGLDAELEAEIERAMAGCYFNLGVIHTQAHRFDRAAALLGEAAELDPDYPRLQYALGVANFNARRFAAALEPLERALASSPDDASLRRMVAMAALESERFERAVALLREDRGRASDPSLELAYGFALVRSGRADEAQAVFDRLLVAHGDWPQLHVLLGQAHAQDGDYGAAIRSLERALELDPEVAEAHGALGVIHLRQGRLEEAEAALAAEVKKSPADLEARVHLATVLDMARRSDEAVPLLRSVLEVSPEQADARYLLGKILLARGQAEPARQQLEAARALSPEQANVRYQLAQAYQRLGLADEARAELAAYRQLKDASRRAVP
jgi:tetratricopeptide (TPR) repeat protein